MGTPTLLCLFGYQKKNGCGLLETLIEKKFGKQYLNVTYTKTDSEKNILLEKSLPLPIEIFHLYKIIKKNKIKHVFYFFYLHPFFIYKLFCRFNYVIMIHDYVQLNFYNFTNGFFYLVGLLNSTFSQRIIVPSVTSAQELTRAYPFFWIKKKLLLSKTF